MYSLARPFLFSLDAERAPGLGLAALDSKADPAFDRAMAERLVAAGARVGAMTPGALAAWLAETLRA